MLGAPMRALTIFAIALGLAAAPALAEPAPIIAPAPEWVETVAIPQGNPELADKPTQSLLMTTQSRYSADGTMESYVETAVAVQSPQGLTSLGNIIIPWQPAQADLIVHKVQIIRGGQPIDLLAKGHQFTVLRRENNLESAMLDGMLTAVMQPEGLAVGDVIDLAYTIRTRTGAIPFRGENLITLLRGSPSRVVRLRDIWPDDAQMRWKATTAMGKPKLRKGKWGNELVLDLRDAEGPEPPAGAPARFQIPGILEVSQYRDWNEIGRMLAPLYASASTLAPDSPLKAEIERIKAGSADPKSRAIAALRLVQDRIRYLALNMGEGGYVPATADQTWTRKFGDCKGKTVTLLALLAGLGIEAEPVLVSTRAGDFLADRLPQIRLFDHVLVRARIDGKSYWFDGTRMGDRRLESLASLSFGWGLPVTEAGAALERLPLPTADEPRAEIMVTYDASKGFEHPVDFEMHIVMHGESAAMARQGISNVGREQMLESMRIGFFPEGSEDVMIHADASDDEVADTFTFKFKGKKVMDWSSVSGSPGKRYRFDHDILPKNLSFERKPGQFAGAPFALPFPFHASSVETVILPNKGEGYVVEGDLDRKLPGGHFRRTVTLENGRAIARSSFRWLQAELPADDAKSATDALAEMASRYAYLRTPADYQMSDSERQLILATKPTSEDGYTNRGYEFLFDNKFVEAAADFEQAVALAPRSARAHANHALALFFQEKDSEAESALARSESLANGEDDFVAMKVRGMLHLKRQKPADAVQAFTRALDLDADSSDVLQLRASAYEELERHSDAMADLERAIRIDPTDWSLSYRRAKLAAFRGDQATALEAADSVAANEDGRIDGLSLKGQLLGRFKRESESKSAYAEALAAVDGKIASASDAEEKARLRRLKINILAETGRGPEAIALAGIGIKERPNNPLELNSRCWHRMLLNLELDQALRDCDQAVRHDPKNANVIDSRAWVKLRLGRFDEAIADFDKALGHEPRQAASLFGRGLAKLRKGDREGGERDMAAARRLDFDVESEFKRHNIVQ